MLCIRTTYNLFLYDLVCSDDDEEDGDGDEDEDEEEECDEGEGMSFGEEAS